MSAKYIISAKYLPSAMPERAWPDMTTFTAAPAAVLKPQQRT
jgi:hypothetical protein